MPALCAAPSWRAAPRRCVARRSRSRCVAACRAAAAAEPPAQRSARLFVNLTNGIEAVPALQSLALPFSFVRLQSSLCEAQAMEKLCLELDANLLVSLALGHDCFVVDYASRNKKRGVPRALWYGLEFVAFALDTLWLGAPVRPPTLRGMNVSGDFEAKLARFDKSTRQRLRYYARFAPPSDGVRLWGVCGPTQRDADGAFYNALLRERLASPPQPPQQPPRGRAAAAAAALGGDTVAALEAAGLRLWTGGMGHAEWREVASIAGAAAGAGAGAAVLAADDDAARAGADLDELE